MKEGGGNEEKEKEMYGSRPERKEGYLRIRRCTRGGRDECI